VTLRWCRRGVYHLHVTTSNPARHETPAPLFQEPFQPHAAAHVATGPLRLRGVRRASRPIQSRPRPVDHVRHPNDMQLSRSSFWSRTAQGLWCLAQSALVTFRGDLTRQHRLSSFHQPSCRRNILRQHIRPVEQAREPSGFHPSTLRIQGKPG